MKLQLPDDANDALLQSAVSLYSDGKLDACARACHAVIALRPNDPRAHQLLGSALLLANRRTRARAAYERARELAPTDAYTLVALGEIYLDDLELDAAVETLEALFALGLPEDAPTLQRARKLLHDAAARLG